MQTPAPVTKTVLQFSGGKDSLACLYLLRERWPEITAAWCNTGAAFPETIAYMERIRRLVPHFVEIKSSQNIEREGYPTDLLPTVRTSLGQAIAAQPALRFQSRWACCSTAIWQPMHQAMKAMGATVIIRGQKRADGLKAPIESGFTHDGIRVEFPIIDWTDADVYAYLDRVGAELPPHYLEGLTSGLDCWNCTAYLADNPLKLEYLRRHHPQRYGHVRAVLAELRIASRQELANLDQVLEGGGVKTAEQIGAATLARLAEQAKSNQAAGDSLRAEIRAVMRAYAAPEPLSAQRVLALIAHTPRPSLRTVQEHMQAIRAESCSSSCAESSASRVEPEQHPYP